MKITENYMEKVYAGWLGKIIGIRLGAPIEGWTYQRIRDVLLPVWRQQSLVARAADKQIQLAQAAEAQARILDEVRAMQARLR